MISLNEFRLWNHVFDTMLSAWKNCRHSLPFYHRLCSCALSDINNNNKHDSNDDDNNGEDDYDNDVNNYGFKTIIMKNINNIEVMKKNHNKYKKNNNKSINEEMHILQTTFPKK